MLPLARSPEEAAAFVKTLQAILRHVGASGANMEKVRRASIVAALGSLANAIKLMSRLLVRASCGATSTYRSPGSERMDKWNSRGHAARSRT